MAATTYLALGTLSDVLDRPGQARAALDLLAGHEPDVLLDLDGVRRITDAFTGPLLAELNVTPRVCGCGAAGTLDQAVAARGAEC